MNKKTVVVVDPVITGNALPYIAVQRGYKCIQVWSSLDRLRECIRMSNHDLYSDTIVNQESLDISAGKQLRSLTSEIVAIVPGSDTAHDLVKQLGLELNIPAGEHNTVLPRRLSDRYLLTVLLNEECTDDPDDMLSMLNQDRTLVVKPKLSTGGYDDVHIVNSQSELPKTTRPMFAQPFHTGTEYAVDIVTYHGEHRLCAVWRYEKHPDSIANDRINLVDYHAEESFCSDIFKYAKVVLETASFQNGAAHLEVMDVGVGFRLIESNFRNHGHLDLKTLYRVFGKENQVTVWANAALESNWVPQLSYSPLLKCRRVLIMNTRSRKGRDLDEVVARLETHHHEISKIWRQHAGHEDVPLRNHTWRNVMINALLTGSSDQVLDETESIMRGALA